MKKKRIKIIKNKETIQETIIVHFKIIRTTRVSGRYRESAACRRGDKTYLYQRMIQLNIQIDILNVKTLLYFIQ